jgi:trimeric autotransporter adhesin
MRRHALAHTTCLLILLPIIAVAQARDAVPLQSWPAPLFWQPSQSEHQAALAERPGIRAQEVGSDIGPAATSPANSLVFVGMTPCRVVDTRTGSGFSGAFGPPSLVGGVSRTFPIQSSTTCSIPSIAQAYSFNITVVPPGFLDYITVWPSGQVRPNASTLNGYVNTVIANAAIVPAGTSGSVDVYASQNTHLIIDINGYYAQQSGITLAQGSAGAPPLSFSGDSGTGIFSTGAGTLNIATGGTSRLSVAPNGDLDLLTGNVRKGGSYFLHNLGVFSTGVGIDALRVNTGSSNTATGARALQNNTTGAGNSALGYQALSFNTTGSNNTAGGLAALNNNTTGNNNTAYGALSLVVNSTGDNNTAYGYGALNANTTGQGNTASGVSALQSNTSGYENTANGYEALRVNTTGFWNTATGFRALFANNSDRNTAIGYSALTANTTGHSNTAMGANALTNNTIGRENTAQGSSALFANIMGSGNTAIGRAALADLQAGNHNTAVGEGALGNATGNDNVAVGRSAGSSVSTGSSNILIGTSVVGGSSDSGTIRIGNQDQIRTFVAGIRGVSTGLANAVNVLIDSAGQLGTVSSSRRFKEDIQDMNGASSGLLRLRPVTFRYQQAYQDGTKPLDYGLIAEEVFEVFPDLVVKGLDGEVQTVQYQKLTPMLLNEVQKQHEELQRQDQIIRQQEQQNRKLEERLTALEALFIRADAIER